MAVSDVLSPSPLRPSTKRTFSQAFCTADRVPCFKRSVSPVLKWLAAQPQSLPPRIEERSTTSFLLPSDEQDLRQFKDMDKAMSQLEETEDLSQLDSELNSQNTARSSADKTSTPAYRQLLRRHDIVIDRLGSKIPRVIREWLVTHILKSRNLPILSEKEREHTVCYLDEFAESSEALLLQALFSSSMFPLSRMGSHGLRIGGDTPWLRNGLPGFGSISQISTPKADQLIGYKADLLTGEQQDVAAHSYAKGFIQPVPGHIAPFLIGEGKSDATGGTIFHAENQAAGAGSSTVRGMQWLFEQADIEYQPTDLISFSFTTNAGHVFIHLNWCSSDEVFYMSKIKSFETTKTEDVQSCSDFMYNIFDWAMGPRLKKFQTTLTALVPKFGRVIQAKSKSRPRTPSDARGRSVAPSGQNSFTSRRSSLSQQTLSQQSQDQSSSLTSLVTQSLGQGKPVSKKNRHK